MKLPVSVIRNVLCSTPTMLSPSSAAGRINSQPTLSNSTLTLQPFHFPGYKTIMGEVDNRIFPSSQLILISFLQLIIKISKFTKFIIFSNNYVLSASCLIQHKHI